MLDINLIWQIHVKYFFFWLHRNIFEKIPWKSNIRYKNNIQEGHKITDWIQKDIVQYLVKVLNRNLIFKTWYTYKNISMHINKNFPSDEFNNFYNLLSSFSLCVILCLITVKKMPGTFLRKTGKLVAQNNSWIIIMKYTWWMMTTTITKIEIPTGFW